MPTRTSSRIVIVGAGVFGLATAYALSKRDSFNDVHITLVDREEEIPSSHKATTASVDTTRIVRSDYADPRYAELVVQAQREWRKPEWSGESGSKRYFESGIILTADRGSESYVQCSLANQKRMAGITGDSSIKELKDEDAIASAFNVGSSIVKGTGNTGYFNAASGWADAEACMRHLRSRVLSSDRIEFVCDQVVNLITATSTDASHDNSNNTTTSKSTNPRITGVTLHAAGPIPADLVILAAGAWSPTLIDLRGVASARGQCIGYLPVSPQEASSLSDIPIHLNLASGCFFFPPANNEIKIASHSFGYTNPVNVPAPAGLDASRGVHFGFSCRPNVCVSVPAHPAEGVPVADREKLEAFIWEAMPLVKGRRLAKTRMCWYLDTPRAEFLVGWHPGFKRQVEASKKDGATRQVEQSKDNVGAARFEGTLFMATGGSGHAFKFLPILGERIVDVLQGVDDEGTWTRKWAFPTAAERAGQEDEVWCRDGSRGGILGMELAQALK